MRRLVSITILISASVAIAADVPAPPQLIQVPTVDTQTRVKEILTYHCYRCHGKDGASEGGFNFVLRSDKLIAGKHYVVPGKPDESLLLQRMADGSMPPPKVQVRPRREDVNIVRQWITDGAVSFDRESSSYRAPSSELQILATVAADVQKITQTGRQFVRYFTTAHLANAGATDDELLTYRHALSKLVNSLSRGRIVMTPELIDAQGTVLRVDMRHYLWSARDWETLAGIYPYSAGEISTVGVSFGGARRINEPPAGAQISFVAQQLNTRLPIVRADWFLATASIAPTYYTLLNLPDSSSKLEDQLDVPVDDNINRGRVVRAAFTNSGISQNNRLIERHESPFGYYWRSYDFVRSDGARNVMANPLGPGQQDFEFAHDGGEIIFSLPNGLQAYMLVDRNGNRINKAATAIVSDPRRPDRAVVAGLSCIRCHNEGIIRKSDQVRPLVSNGVFPRAVQTEVLQIYKPAAEFDLIQKQDGNRFLQAVLQTGKAVSQTEPISTLVLRYEAPLDLSQVAAETGLDPLSLISRFKSSEQARRSLAALSSTGGTVQRETFLEVFPDVVNSGSSFTLFDVR